MYINGIERYNHSLSESIEYETSDVFLVLGQQQMGYKNIGWKENSFQGHFDEIRLWSREITVEEVSTKMYSGIQDQDGLFGYWPIDDIESTPYIIKDVMENNDGVFAVLNDKREVIGPLPYPNFRSF